MKPLVLTRVTHARIGLRVAADHRRQRGPPVPGAVTGDGEVLVDLVCEPQALGHRRVVLGAEARRDAARSLVTADLGHPRRLSRSAWRSAGAAGGARRSGSRTCGARSPRRIGAVPGTASQRGASSARIASAVVSSAMTLAYGAVRASAAPSARTTQCPLRDRDLHALLAAVAEAVVGLVHRADVLQRDVVDVVEPFDDRGEVVRVGGFAAGFQAAAARFPVRRELRRRTVDEAGQDRHARVVRRRAGTSDRPCRRQLALGARAGVFTPTPPPPML